MMNKTISKVFVYDKYQIILASVLTDYDRKLLTRLYQPLSGYGPIALYITLWSEFDKEITKSEELTHKNLFEMMQCSVNDFEAFRNKLEGLGLLKTYVKEESDKPFYVYELYAPLGAKEFFRHELLGTLIKQRLGEEDHKKIKSSFIKIRDNKKEYLNISHNFADVYNLDMNDTKTIQSVISETDPLFSRENANIESNLNLDIFLLALKNKKIKKNLVNNQLIELMNSMINLYKLDENELADIILVSMDKTSLVEKIDMDIFRKKCFEYKKFNNEEETQTVKVENKSFELDKKTQMLSELEPFQFLKIKQGNQEPSLEDRILIEDLSLMSKLNPGVINVLIDYVMIKQENTLPSQYVLKIASSLVKNNIKTTQEAMGYFYKITNSYTKPKTEVAQKKTYSKLNEEPQEKAQAKKTSLNEQEENEAAEQLKRLKKIRKERKQNEESKV